MADPTVIVWPLLTILSAAGLCAIAPPRIRTLYLAPAGCTVTVIALVVAYVTAVWSH